MAPREVDRTVQETVLDRLIDEDPTSGVEAPKTWAQSVADLKRALRRDLEWLLNTRRIILTAPPEYSELAGSLYHFGLPDFTGLSAEAPDTGTRLRREVEEAVTRYERRLSGVRVSLVETDEEGRREVRFVIEGLLCMEPSPEQVAFDTVLETVSGWFQVRGGGRA